MSDTITATARSKLAEQIRARPRKVHVYDVAPFMCMGETRARVAIRIPTKKEQDRALVGAHQYMVKRAGATPSVINDPEIMQDAKSAFIVAECCFEADRADGDVMPLWPTGNEVSEDLSTDEIAVLVNLVNEVRAKLGPTPHEITEEQVEAFARVCSVGAGTTKPDEVLTPLPHYFVVQLAILFAVRLAEARQTVDDQAKALDATNRALAETVPATEAP